MTTQALRELRELLEFPTISADASRGEAAFRDCAAWLVRHMRAIGLRAGILNAGGRPVVVGESRRYGDRPTTLIYGHYDVQPVDPIGEWTSPPFEPAVRDEHLYARGATDDKGQFFAHLKAVEQHLCATGDLPVNVRFLLEGEEEIGSPSLGRFLQRFGSRVNADVAVVSDTRILDPDRPALTYALRGSLAIEIELTGAPADLHSGNFGGALHNPLQGLCDLLASLHDREGRVAVRGFYDAVQPLAPSERRYLAVTGPSETELTASAGTPATWGEPGFTPAERTTIRPAIVITGLTGGYQGVGAKGVLPSRASAKVNVRLVPAQDPRAVDRAIRRHLLAAAPRDLQIHITTQMGVRPVIVDVHHPAIRAASAAYREGFGRPPVFVRSGGTIPVVDLLQRALRVPTVLMGFALPDSGMHGPNERLHLPTFLRSVTTSSRFLSELARRGMPAIARGVAS